MLNSRQAHAERASAPLESIFAVVFVMMLALGAVQVAFLLYGRNVVAAAAHEGARAAVERGRDAHEAAEIAGTTVRRAAGRMARDIRVGTAMHVRGTVEIVEVEVSARLNSFGPVPLSPTVTSTAGASREAL